MNKDQTILLVGAGPMAIEYAKALKALEYSFIVVGRSEKSAKNFKDTTGISVVTGGIEKFLEDNLKLPKKAIIAVSEEQLGITTKKLLNKGVKNILVEKPAGLDFKDIQEVHKLSRKLSAKVYVGYNRRFYASVKKTLEIIKKDDGILSIFFDFSEPDFKIAPLIKGPGVKENWFLQNSTHVVDLAFFLAGVPRKLISYTSGSLPWHPKAAIFSGAGETKKKTLFSYHANWKGPGRWGIEVVTKNHKLFLRPLEKLQIQKQGTFLIEDEKINDELDIKFKPGLYKQLESFFGDKTNLCTIEEQIRNLEIYKQILEGKN